RAQVEELMNADLAAVQQQRVPDAVRHQIIDLGTTYQIMTQFTSFVAIENLRVTVGGEPRLVPVPVELPDGQDYDATMGQAESTEPLQQTTAADLNGDGSTDVMFSLSDADPADMAVFPAAPDLQQ